MTPPIDRRRFLKDSAALTAGLAAAGAVSARAADESQSSKKAGPNDAIRVAVVGVHGRGMDHVRGYLDHQDEARIVAICDCDSRVTGPALKRISQKYGSEPKVYQDIRKLLDDKDVDAISVATPNHWHSLMGVWGCQAGKDVYLEKPVSHNVTEGRRVVEAARKYDKIVQTGTQCRSHKGIQDAIDFVRSGKLGKVYMARGLCYKWRPSIGFKPDTKAPEGLDYNLWLGPAPEQPFNENYVHYNWHWFWDFGNGDLGNQGIHQMDLARWGLGKDEFPKSVVASGGRFGYEDQGQTPNTESVTFEFDDCILQFDVRGLPTNDELGAKVGDIFYGSEGVLVIDSYTSWRTYFGQKMEPGPKGEGGGDHYANFLKAVRSRKAKDLNADIEQGHLSSAYCHLGNIAYKLGRKLHLNPSSESFVNDPEANAMLTREYRAPFVVPEKV